MLRKLYTSVEEIKRLNGLTNEIDPKCDTFCDVVGSYFLPEKIRCSKTDCHQMHLEGAIVKLGSGKLSYIGHKCAKTIFGESYELAWESHRDEIVLPQMRGELATFKHELAKISNRVTSIKAQVPDYLELKQKLVQFFPEVHRYILALYRSGKTKVVLERERTKEQIENLRALNPRMSFERLKFEEVTVGYLTGLAVFEEFNPAIILQADLIPGIQSVTEANLYLLPKSQVFALHKWSREVEHKLTRLENWISCAKTFFSDENLKILKGLSTAERLKLEIDRLNMASLSRLELRAANEQLRSVLQSKKIPEQKIITAKENGRISAGMNAFRRLTGT